VKSLTLTCLILAVIAAVFYFPTGFNVITVPSAGGEGGPPGWAFIAGGCYLVGGFLLLIRRRWLWILGLIANTLVIIFFFILHYQHPQILTCLPGLGTKIAQILLEIGLLILIINFRKSTKTAK
jgi:hypothetical protein